MPVEDGRTRVIIENITPRVDDGAFPIKRIVGDTLTVEADVFTDGHDAISCVLLYRKEDEPAWIEAPMEALVNDRWRGSFAVRELGRYLYTVGAWVDHFKSWSRDLAKRVEANQDVTVDLIIGADMIAAAGTHAPPYEAGRFEIYAESVRAGGPDGIARALSAELAGLMRAHATRLFARTHRHHFAVMVDRERARFGAWYELFPRSCASTVPGVMAPSRTSRQRLPYVAAMGFDVLYLPPIHPIGSSFRKGPNNATVVGPDDPGSPWAIGSAEGGHKAIHPELGTLDDFRRLVDRAAQHGIEIALDIAFQCAPDHPYVTEHPEWFRRRPDGTIQYAENPPKKYQDIYPFDFETEHWRELWDELKSVVQFWVDQGVRIFRVDNPHTKPFPFWEWLIAEIKQDCPEVDLPRRGLHASQGHVPPGQGRLYPVLQLLPLAQHQVGADRIPHRADPDRRARVLRPEPLAQHPGYPARVPPVWRTAGLHGAAYPGGYPGSQLRHLRAGLRAVR